ncbi:MAG: hypothetical protein NUV31_02230 [Dehalococcoidales bacterium]|nr:hypothetical protein [Dehalococcoidales bacterium]
MELSPLAKEKLAKIGELTEEEKAKLKYNAQLNTLLADYFTAKMTPDELWKELKKLKDEGKRAILQDAQLRLLDTITLSMNDVDFDRRYKGILAAETLKDGGDYVRLEQELKAVETLRRRYREEIDRTYQVLRERVEEQVRLASRQIVSQAAAQGAVVDFESSVEATVKASPEWKDFISRHENIYRQKLKEALSRIREKLQR